MRTSLRTVLLLLTVSVTLPGCSDERSQPASAVRSPIQGLQWETEWDQAFARARAEQRSVLVYFFEDWCVWCRKLETEVLAQPEVTAALAGNVVVLRLDAAGSGKEYAARLEVDRLPTLIVLSSEEHALGRLEGYASSRQVLSRLVPLVGSPQSPASP